MLRHKGIHFYHDNCLRDTSTGINLIFFFYGATALVVLAFSTIAFRLKRSWTCSTHFIAFIFSKSSLTSSSHRYLGLPTGLLVNGFHVYIFCTILVSGILFVCPNQLNLCALTQFIMFRCFISSSNSLLVLILQGINLIRVTNYSFSPSQYLSIGWRISDAAQPGNIRAIDLILPGFARNTSLAMDNEVVYNNILKCNNNALLVNRGKYFDKYKYRWILSSSEALRSVTWFDYVFSGLSVGSTLQGSRCPRCLEDGTIT